jgi:hypothetical protein
MRRAVLGLKPMSDDSTLDPAPTNDGIDVSDPELLADFKDWFRTDRDHRHEWAAEATEDYDFVALRQWSDEDKLALEEQNRPPVTFSRIGPMVKIVCGLEVGNRQEVRYIPREQGDVAVNELLTEAARWVRDEGDAEDEESDAFRDLVICGMGWCDTKLEFDENPDGKLAIERIDPLEMFWDASASKKNLSDARRLWRVRDVPLYEAREMYPKASRADLHAAWAGDIAGNPKIQHDDPRDAYSTNVDEGSERGRERDLVRLVEVQWWERETTWRAIDPFTGQQATFPDDKWGVLKERLAALGIPEPYAVRQKKRVYWRAMIGAVVLEIWRGPDEGGFTWKCMTGERDRNKGTWFGIVRCMIDPQRWANKWLSQMMHIMNTGAKGGIMAEETAFADIRKAEDDWADPQAIVMVAPGAIAGSKIMPRPVTPMPPALGEMMTLAMSAIRDSTGVNLETLGLVERDQPGIVEYSRKQAGMTVLAGLFDALRRYRKDQGRLMLWYITNFLSDGRLIRIGGQDQAKYVPLLKQEGISEYDVIVDDTPTSPNLKERTWETMTQLMPLLARQPLPPEVYLELLKYSPLPETVTAKIAAIIEQQKAQPKQPDPTAAVAQSIIPLNAAKAQLAQAQAEKARADMLMGSHTARAENAETQLQAAKLAMSGDETRAKIEQMRSAALLNVAKAEAAEAGRQTEQYLAILDTLDSIVSWHQAQTATPA